MSVPAVPVTRRAQTTPPAIRAALLAALFQRAAGRRVFGYCSRTGRVAVIDAAGRVRPGSWRAEQMGGDVDRASVEGDTEWTLLPPAAAGREG